jgi:antitoxin component HigA of HigAB toxin-antitoxin module
VTTYYYDPTTDTYREAFTSPEERLGMAQAEARFRAGEVIHEALDAEGVSQHELAQRLGRTDGAVSQVLWGHRNLTLNTLVEYLHALGYKLQLSAVPHDAPAREASAP